MAQGLYMAQVAKSTITPIGPVKIISKNNTNGRIGLERPFPGFAYWHSVTGPHKIVAHELQNRHVTMDKTKICFFMV
jgi:hypothetical protein